MMLQNVAASSYCSNENHLDFVEIQIFHTLIASDIPEGIRNHCESERKAN